MIQGERSFDNYDEFLEIFEIDSGFELVVDCLYIIESERYMFNNICILYFCID